MASGHCRLAECQSGYLLRIVNRLRLFVHLHGRTDRTLVKDYVQEATGGLQIKDSLPGTSYSPKESAKLGNMELLVTRLLMDEFGEEVDGQPVEIDLVTILHDGKTADEPCEEGQFPGLISVASTVSIDVLVSGLPVYDFFTRDADDEHRRTHWKWKANSEIVQSLESWRVVGFPQQPTADSTVVSSRMGSFSGSFSGSFMSHSQNSSRRCTLTIPVPNDIPALPVPPAEGTKRGSILELPAKRGSVLEVPTKRGSVLEGPRKSVLGLDATLAGLQQPIAPRRSLCGQAGQRMSITGLSGLQPGPMEFASPNKRTSLLNASTAADMGVGIVQRTQKPGNASQGTHGLGGRISEGGEGGRISQGRSSGGLSRFGRQGTGPLGKSSAGLGKSSAGLKKQFGKTISGGGDRSSVSSIRQRQGTTLQMGINRLSSQPLVLSKLNSGG